MNPREYPPRHLTPTEEQKNCYHDEKGDGVIVETRYRDIPAEDMMAVHSGMFCSRTEQAIKDSWEKTRRGKPIRIITPHIPTNDLDWSARICRAHWYQCADSSDWVCEHIAEIGD